MSIESIKAKLSKLNNNRFPGGAGTVGQSYNAIPFPEFEDSNVWRKSPERAKMVLDSLGDVEGKRILDLGCNVGFFSFLLSQRGAYVTGIEIDEDCVEIARDVAQYKG